MVPACDLFLAHCHSKAPLAQDPFSITPAMVFRLSFLVPFHSLPQNEACGLYGGHFKPIPGPPECSFSLFCVLCSRVLSFSAFRYTRAARHVSCAFVFNFNGTLTGFPGPPLLQPPPLGLPFFSAWFDEGNQRVLSGHGSQISSLHTLTRPRFLKSFFSKLINGDSRLFIC